MAPATGPGSQQVQGGQRRWGSMAAEQRPVSMGEDDGFLLVGDAGAESVHEEAAMLSALLGGDEAAAGGEPAPGAAAPPPASAFVQAWERDARELLAW